MISPAQRPGDRHAERRPLDGRTRAGREGAIPLERLSAIEDVTILLYGRLSFISPSERLTIRYNTLARPA